MAVSTWAANSRVGSRTSSRGCGLCWPSSREDRQRERRGLAGAGLRAADHVLPGEDQRNGAKLNGRGLDVTHGLHAFEHGLGKA